jgi:hypothetical protein
MKREIYTTGRHRRLSARLAHPATPSSSQNGSSSSFVLLFVLVLVLVLVQTP